MSGSAERVWIAVAALAGAAAVVAALAIAGVFGGDGGEEVAAEGFGVATASAPTAPEATGPPVPAQPTVKRIDVGGRPDTIAAGAGYVWVADSLAGTLRRIHPTSLRPVPIEAAGFPTDISAGEGAAWLALPDRGAVQRLTVAGPAEPAGVRGFPFQIAAGEGGVFAMSQKTVERIDPSSGQPDGSPVQLEGSGAAIAAGEGWVWVVRGNREVVRISPEDGELAGEAATVPKAFNVTVGESAAWALGADGDLVRIDPGTGEVAGDPVPTGRPLDVAAGLGYVWVAGAGGTVLRIDPARGSEVGAPIEAGKEAQAIAIGEGAVWVASPADGAVYRITP